MFHCKKCGECCRNLEKSDLYKELHDGFGICKYLKGNLCSIYEKRPLLCRVDKCYDVFFKGKMTYEKYITINQKVCRKLRKIKKEK